jgi:hypothetical protein
MATPERQDATAPEPWHAPVDAIIANARTELSRDWSDYLRLIEESLSSPLLAIPSTPAARATRRARRRLLAGPKSLEPSWLQWEEIGRLNPGIGTQKRSRGCSMRRRVSPRCSRSNAGSWPRCWTRCGQVPGKARISWGRSQPDLVSPTASGRLAKRDYIDWHGAAVVRAPAPPDSRDAAGSAHGARNGVHRRGRDTAYPAASVVRSGNWRVCK